MNILAEIAEALLIGISLCADCFAVSLCASLGMNRQQLRSSFWKVAPSFAVIQSLLLVAGWLAAHLAGEWMAAHLAHYETIAHIIAFLLLLWIGLEMVIDSLRKEETTRLELKSFKSIIVGGIATSIDALAVGASMGLADISATDITLQAAAVFLCTWLSVVVGIFFGQRLGKRLGNIARLIGGIILIIIGLLILI